MHDDGPIAAGSLSAWLAAATDPERRTDMDVPCGTCTACCRSSYFIHVAPDETDALGHIPPALLFPAPGRPKGHKVLGFDEQGRCPMLTDAGCSIYDHRPRTCRSYDCRVFAATGLSPADDGKLEIAARTRRWRFDDEEEAGGAAELQALRRAARYLRERRDECFPDGGPPSQVGQLAALAVQVHRLFLTTSDPDPVTVRRALAEIGD